MFATMREPPQKGRFRSLFSCCMCSRRNKSSTHGFERSLTIVEKDKAKEVFDDYMKVAFPWLETSKRREKDDIIKVLQGEVKKGAMGIKPLARREDAQSAEASRCRSRRSTKENARRDERPLRKTRQGNSGMTSLRTTTPTRTRLPTARGSALPAGVPTSLRRRSPAAPRPATSARGRAPSRTSRRSSSSTTSAPPPKKPSAVLLGHAEASWTTLPRRSDRC